MSMFSSMVLTLHTLLNDFYLTTYKHILLNAAKLRMFLDCTYKIDFFAGIINLENLYNPDHAKRDISRCRNIPDIPHRANLGDVFRNVDMQHRRCGQSDSRQKY